ncbi:hypothetical protein PGT21_018275 [Puccinia graminis f. sp. tritici]|uniref:Uncharacterized protein n=1 Tax=Puccinia graminis f. sp. tritici TaxID=56615 RepID=A0A5B0MTB4_PUCGR|nr:hypothetical protein PGT21_019086 [Puccinia graminis f. sp. tritici]KAA1082878.1 hypothetical protein PGT21_018275 [Puccinia graminis f. sp. tritici]KAA1084948.1 hypothetical protein PGTUg99_002603 [Puccinia graminis f. sp. tritici]KAA1118271.1 hypothetical protein PGTUg99_001313 [Puccinia graminis f. sp. tritici]
MSDSSSFPTLTYNIVSTLTEKEEEVTYSYYWKIKEIRTFLITTRKTYLQSSRELLGQSQHKRLVSIITKKTRQNLDTGTPSPLNPSIRKTLEETAIINPPQLHIEDLTSNKSLYSKEQS